MPCWPTSRKEPGSEKSHRSTTAALLLLTVSPTHSPTGSLFQTEVIVFGNCSALSELPVVFGPLVPHCFLTVSDLKGTSDSCFLKLF